MRLIACPDCHTQYDVTEVADSTVRCRCGSELENREYEAIEARVYSCGSCSAQVESSDTHCKYCGSQIVRDDGKLSLICPECYCRNADDARFCTACGVTFAPETVEAKGVALPCPCCGCLMAVRSLVGVGLNECAECNGIWVPGNEFETLITRAIDARKNAVASSADEPSPRVVGANPAGQRVQYRRCPNCEALMQRRNFRKTSGIIVDRCSEHGTWLDADELEQIAGFIMSGGRPDAEAFLKDMEEKDRKQQVANRVADPWCTMESGNPQVATSSGTSLLHVLFDLLS